MAKFEEIEVVRLTAPIDVRGEDDPETIHHLPTGTEGTVLLVHGDGAAYEVEFILREPVVAGDEILDYGDFGTAAVPADKLESTGWKPVH